MKKDKMDQEEHFTEFKPHLDDFFFVLGKPSEEYAGEIFYIPLSRAKKREDGGGKEDLIEFRDQLGTVKVEDLI